MPSTTNRDCNWYIRAGGAELNGGGFDSTVTNAGTNYADQDAAQLSLTDMTTVGVSASVASVVGGFTAAMIGNVMRISAGTNFTADYYVITAYTDGNNVTLDRNCATGAGTGGTCRVGGAFVHAKSLATSSGSGTNNPILATPLIGGHNINVRGAGTQDPSVSDFDWSGDYWNFPSGGGVTTTTGNIKWIGYNGRPRISHRGLFAFTGKHHFVQNMKWYQSLGTWLTHWIFEEPSTSYYNCICDVGGFDAKIAQLGNSSQEGGSIIATEFRNTGGGAIGTSPYAIGLAHGGGLVFGCWIHDVRSLAAIKAVGCLGVVQSCLISNNKGDGYYDDETDGSAPIVITICSNTFYNNAGHGLNLVANAIADNAIFNNIISHHTGASKFAVNFVDTYKINIQKYKYFFNYNDYFGNTTNFNTVSSVVAWAINPTADGPLAGDLTLDPQYTSAGSNDFSPSGTNLKGVGIHSVSIASTAYKINIGAVFA